MSRPVDTETVRCISKRGSPTRLVIPLIAAVLLATVVTGLPAGSAVFRTSLSGAQVTHADRIISLSPTATEILFAIGAGRQVVAVDDDSDYPKDAPHSDLSGLDPNVEAIARYRPDLVVVSFEPAGLVKSLQSLGIALLYQPPALNISGTYTQIEQLGRMTGRSGAARSLVSSMRKNIAAAVAGAPRLTAHPTYYWELDQTFYSLTSSTFVGGLLKMFGLVNIADRAKGASSGYPQLSDEYIVKANPGIIFLADTLCCHQSASTVAARPGWRAIGAVRDGDVFGLNDDIASRWGPRVVLLADDIERALWRYERRLAS
jgi:iron complex transport system substrate-binding protein